MKYEVLRAKPESILLNYGEKKDLSKNDSKLKKKKSLIMSEIQKFKTL